jgi:hypothetical protein
MVEFRRWKSGWSSDEIRGEKEMVSSTYDLVAREADALSSDEQLRLIARLAERLATVRAGQAAEERLRWEDFAGSVPPPLCGEDAQQWVTRTRLESDERRVIP